MMKNIIYLIVFFYDFSFAQFNSQKEKYWIYRERMKNFVVSDPCVGCGIPANSREIVGAFSYGDVPWFMGYWIGTLAMEYDLVSKACAAGSSDACTYLNQTKHDLFYAIEAINKIDYEAEGTWGCAPELNGFMLRDNIPADFATEVVGNEFVYDKLNEGFVPPLDYYTVKCFNSAFTSYFGGASEASQDHLTGLYIGLALVKAKVSSSDFFDDGTGPKQFMDGKTKFVEEIQEISNRIITHLSAGGGPGHHWIYWNPCEDRCVLGVTIEQYANPCIDNSTTQGDCNGDCCGAGGARARPQAIGYAAVNKYIQSGSSYASVATTWLIDLVRDGFYNNAWEAALIPNSGTSRIPKTLAALGNVWHFGVLNNNIVVSDPTKKVAKKIKKESELNHWEHLILLHRLIYGDQYKDNGDLISISDNFYNCMLDVAPCRGFDGTTNSGGNVEWGCLDRLAGERGINNDGSLIFYDCDKQYNDGIPGWPLNSFNRIDVMFYFNLFHIVSQTQSAISFSPTPIKELALPDIDKNNYTEQDKKNFMAANTITAHNNYIIDNSILGQGRVTFVAGRHIDLLPGFQITNGATLDSHIDPTVMSMGCISIANSSTDPAIAVISTDCSSNLEKIIQEDTSTIDDLTDTIFVFTDSTSDSTTLRSNNQYENNEEQSVRFNRNISIIPNPSTGIFTLICKDYLQTIEVRDVLGNIVFSKTINNQPVNLDIDIAAHPHGIYFIKAQSKDNIYTEKVVVQ